VIPLHETEIEILQMFDEEDIKFIQSCHKDTGVLRSFIEKCENAYHKQWAEHFIRVNEIEIENTIEEMKDGRSKIEFLERLQRGRSGGELPGDEADLREEKTELCYG
jgi:hypothetical protein